MALAIQTNFDAKLEDARRLNDSFLCVGLDPDLSLISPKQVVRLNEMLVDATTDLACAYKPNLAIYESLGNDAHETLLKTLDYIRQECPDVPIIGDAKRGDIALCGKSYAKTLFEVYGFDAVTANPYMGEDALEPFLKHDDRGVFILCRTSNPNSGDLQDLRLDSGEFLYEKVAELAECAWNENNNVGLVVGATYPEDIRRVRDICPDMTFLIPGVGAQGGHLDRTVSSALNSNGGGFTINASRQIMYAAKDVNGEIAFDEAAHLRVREAALNLRDEINCQVRLTRERAETAIAMSAAT